jgi:hypothetical protein
MKTQEDQLRDIIDAIPALAWSARRDGSAEFFNRRWLGLRRPLYRRGGELGLDRRASPRRSRHAHGILATRTGLRGGRRD